MLEKLHIQTNFRFKGGKMKIFFVILLICFLFWFFSIRNILLNIWLELCNTKEYVKDFAVRYAFNDESNKKEEK